MLVYLDDLIIFSADAESHLSHLDMVLSFVGGSAHSFFRVTSW